MSGDSVSDTNQHQDPANQDGRLDTAVALILFNRADTTERVMQRIAEARPKQLFLIADGPRIDRPGEAEACDRTRAAAEALIDWDCEVHRNYAEQNLGCGERPASGISWVFEHVEQAIILEDDCVPHPTFFRFCDELLNKYKDDTRVAQVSGNFHHYNLPGGDASYFFSRHIHCAGGWATWRRVWETYDITAAQWANLRDTPWLEYHLVEPEAVRIWRRLLDAAFEAKGLDDYWDYQWAFNCFLHNGLSIVPNVGLLTNVGFRPDGTHTLHDSKWGNLPMEAMAFPLDHPAHVTPDAASDRNFVEHFLMDEASTPTPSRMRRLAGPMRSAIKRLTQSGS